MRITFLSPAPDRSGGQRVIAIYAKALSERGHSVSVICAQRTRLSRWRRIQNVLRCRTCGPRRITANSHYEEYDIDYRVVGHQGPIVEEDLSDGDVLLATWWETAEWVARLPHHKGHKLHLVQGHEVFAYLPQARARASYRLPLKKICVSNWLQTVIRTEYGDTSTALVPNAVDLRQFNAPMRRKTANHLTLGLVYSPAVFKGADVCLEAVRIAKRSIDLEFIAFGSAEPSDTQHRELIDEFRSSPPQNVLRDIYGACDAWLFGSREEGFGLPILEAMACRTPVIATPAGAAPELIRQGGGILVRHEDPQDMADAILRIQSMDNAEWRIMSDAAYRTASSYTWEDATTQFEGALLAAVNGTWEQHCTQRLAAQKTSVA